jgi:hypothetical protein
MKPAVFIKEQEYICKCDRNEKPENQTKFVIGSLTVEQEAFVSDNSDGYDGSTKYGSLILLRLHLGLHRVVNFDAKMERDKNAPALPGGVQPWTSDSLFNIPEPERREICMKIRTINEIQVEEAKN